MWREVAVASIGVTGHAKGVAHRNRTALISLGISKLVRFDKIRHQSVTNRLLLVFLYHSRGPKGHGSS
jgi:hypothetical protein